MAANSVEWVQVSKLGLATCPNEACLRGAPLWRSSKSVTADGLTLLRQQAMVLAWGAATPSRAIIRFADQQRDLMPLNHPTVKRSHNKAWGRAVRRNVTREPQRRSTSRHVQPLLSRKGVEGVEGFKLGLAMVESSLWTLRRHAKIGRL